MFYVINLGRQVNNRVVKQNAADAAAIGGAGWVARSLNIVAMDNVAISRYLADVNTLDSIPPVTAAALDEQQVLLDALGQHANFSSGHAGLDQIANQQIALLVTKLQEEVALLSQANDLFRGYDVARMTNYQGPGGRGELWRAMESLDELSQATMENLGPLAQLSAVNSGEVNLTQARPDSAALMAPLTPEVPWRRGVFDDFEQPVTRGRLPLAVDDPIVRRGPYDTVFGWRNYSYVGGGVIDDNIPPVWQGAQGVNLQGNGSPFGGGQPGNGGFRGGAVQQAVPSGYRTFGTQSWCIGLMGNFTERLARPNLNRSRFFPWFIAFADAKLHYLWPGDGQRYFARPVWNRAYPAQLPRADQPLPISETVFFRLNMKSRFSYLGGAVPGTWAFISKPPNAQESAVEIVRQGGWWLPRRPNINPPVWMMQPTELGAQAASGPNVWVYQYPYQVMEDPEIGIVNTGVPQTAYFVQVIAFAAVNQNLDPPDPLLDAPNGNDDIAVLNPYAGFNRGASDAPSPIDLDHSRVLPTGPSRRDYLTFLGVARQGDVTPDWPSKFRGDKPYPNMVAVAQAKVFNDHSWDLWTQMWHAQLEPVSGFDQWTAALDADAESSAVSPAEVASMKEYFTAIAPLAPTMLSH